MMIHDSVDVTERVSLSNAHAARPQRSPARLLAEAVWFLIWHIAASVVSGARWVLLAERVRRERWVLSRMDDAQLRDLGVDRRRALQEASRACYDLPAARRRQRANPA